MADKFVDVRLSAYWVQKLRRACGMTGDPFAEPPRTARERHLQQSGRNQIAVEIAVVAYIEQFERFQAALKGGA